MAERTTYDCDRCGTKDVRIERFFLTVGQQPDAAGGPSEDISVRVDLCHRCTALELRSFLKGIAHGEAEKWVQAVRDRVKRK